MFRRIARLLVTSILRWEARLVLKKYRPKIVAITGSVGKTGTKDAIALALTSKYKLRASQKSFNSELGLPLTILGCDNPWRSFFGWLRVWVEGFGLIFFRSDYPECLVLELGVDRPGDMAMILSWLKVDVAVITNLPQVPAHVEFFHSPELVLREKWLLAESVAGEGLVVCNHDDEKIRALANNLKSRQLSYGFRPGADFLGSDIQIIYDDQGDPKQPSWPAGLSLQVVHGDESARLELRGVLGQHQLSALLAAAAVAVAQGVSLTELSQVLPKLVMPPGRMKLIAGIKETLIIDDTYNASPAALAAALQTLGDLRVAGRKIAVLGDMLELGRYAIEEHRKVGVLAARVSHVLVTVGLRMQFAVEEAMRKKMGKKNVYHFNDSRAAGEFLQNFIAKSDVVLVKGSQSLRMERVVEEIMAHPEDKVRLLVRQDQEWQKR